MRKLFIIVVLLAMFSPSFASAAPIECFCVTYLRQFIPDLPRQDAEDFVPNTAPQVGAVVIHRYWSEKTNEWVYHVGLLAATTDDGGWIEFGSNLTSCEPYIHKTREDDSLVGFYRPIPSHHGLPATYQLVSRGLP